MCGDLEEDGPGDLHDALYARFLANARAVIEKGGDQPGEAGDIVANAEKLFVDALSRAVKDAQNAGDGKSYEALAMTPMVFARLAGFLAGHLSLHEDPLRNVMEALMHGYAEAGEMEPAHDHHHDHHHGHGHHHSH